MKNRRELMVRRRGEAPLVPPYILRNFKLDGTVALDRTDLAWPQGIAYPASRCEPHESQSESV